MKPYYVAVKDGDYYRHLVKYIQSDQDLENFENDIAEQILYLTDNDEFSDTEPREIISLNNFEIVKVPKHIYDHLIEKPVALVSMDSEYITPINDI